MHKYVCGIDYQNSVVGSLEAILQCLLLTKKEKKKAFRSKP